MSIYERSPVGKPPVITTETISANEDSEMGLKALEKVRKWT